jgi:hypothetical protein
VFLKELECAGSGQGQTMAQFNKTIITEKIRVFLNAPNKQDCSLHCNHGIRSIESDTLGLLHFPPSVLPDIPLQASSHYVYANVGSDVFQQRQALWSGGRNGRGWRGIYE